MNHILETERLYLRELSMDDKTELAKILCDTESMKYYPKAFSLEKVENWINWNIDSYKKHNHGLWAVILKDGNVFLGDCGITIQDIDGENLPELGYHINKNYCNKGYATEAAKACMDYSFNSLGLKTIYTYTKSDNLPSIKVAQKNGMEFVKHFKKVVMGETVTEVLFCKNSY